MYRVKRFLLRVGKKVWEALQILEVAFCWLAW